jgi:hypothetical protein
MSKDYIKISENDTHRLKICIDDCPDNPRDSESFENLGTIAILNRRSGLGDNQYDNLTQFYVELLNDYIPGDFDGDTEDYVEYLCKDSKTTKEANKAVIEEIKKFYVILPVFVLDHSGISISTRDFNDSWDSYIAGFIYVDNYKVMEVNDILLFDGNTVEDTERILNAEIEIYNNYVQGNVFGFILEEKATCQCCKHTEYNHINSCWRFYGELTNDELKQNLVGDRFKELIDSLHE